MTLHLHLLLDWGRMLVLLLCVVLYAVDGINFLMLTHIVERLLVGVRMDHLLVIHLLQRTLF